MSEARSREEWLRTSWMLAKIHNVFAASDKDRMTPEDFNPWLRDEAAKREKANRIEVPITALKSLITATRGAS